MTTKVARVNPLRQWPEGGTFPPSTVLSSCRYLLNEIESPRRTALRRHVRPRPRQPYLMFLPHQHSPGNQIDTIQGKPAVHRDMSLRTRIPESKVHESHRHVPRS